MSQKSALKILVIDDEADVADIIAINLKTAGFEVFKAYDGEDGLEKAKAKLPDLIILDLMLPKMHGLDVCEALKKNAPTARIPVIMLTAKTEVDDRITGFEFGADDYIPKPFSPRELALRVESVLRRARAAGAPTKVLTAGKIQLDENRCEVRVENKLIVLTATEFKLLSMLMDRKGNVLNRDILLNDVWGYSSAIDTRTVDTHIRRLREKLGDVASCIETIRGIGYRMNEPQ